MRILKPVVLSIVLSGMFSCQHVASSNETEPDPASQDASQDSNFKTLDTAISFHGFWVNETFAASLRETQSPLLATIPENSCIYIPDRTLKPTGMIYGFHEGGEAWVVVKNGTEHELWDENMENKRSSIRILPGGKLQIGKESFVKLKYDNRSETQPTILEELLFAGTYKDPQGGSVVFTYDGRVSGLDSFQTYSAAIDVMEENVDRMGLAINRGRETDFGYRFRNDTLRIFELDCLDYDSTNKACITQDLGKLRYILVKTGK